MILYKIPSFVHAYSFSILFHPTLLLSKLKYTVQLERWMLISSNHMDKYTISILMITGETFQRDFHPLHSNQFQSVGLSGVLKGHGQVTENSYLLTAPSTGHCTLLVSLHWRNFSQYSLLCMIHFPSQSCLTSHFSHHCGPRSGSSSVAARCRFLHYSL